MNQFSSVKLIRYFFKFISRLGDGLFWYLLMAGLLVYENFLTIIPVMHMAVFGGLGTLIYLILKNKIARPRPFEVNQAILMQGKVLDRFSFPSGHTMHAVIFSLIAIHYYPFLELPLIMMTILISLSRVILGLHYVSDVLISFIIGFFIFELSLFISWNKIPSYFIYS